MRALFKAMLMLAILLVMVSPSLAQELSPGANDNEAIVGMLVVAAIAITFSLVDGVKTGRILENTTESVRYLINHPGIGYAIERRISKWPAERRAFINSIIAVADPFTDFDSTQLDDEVKAWLRDMLDGTVEPEPKASETADSSTASAQPFTQ